MPPSKCAPVAERCESGRIDMLGKHASGQLDRGFESHPLRHSFALPAKEWRDLAILDGGSAGPHFVCPARFLRRIELIAGG